MANMTKTFDLKLGNGGFGAEMVLESATTEIPGVTVEGGTHSFRKYSLRPRASAKKQSNGPQPPAKLRGRPTRVKAAPKAKPPVPVLSKYRRKNANARERYRMKAINDGFEALRRVVPFQPDDGCAEKKLSLTKITTLRLAIEYIQALGKLLEDHDAGRISANSRQEFSAPDDEDFFEICGDWKINLLSPGMPSCEPRSDNLSDESSSGFCSDDNNQFLEDFLDPFDSFSPFPSTNDSDALDALFSPSSGCSFDLDNLCEPDY